MNQIKGTVLIVGALIILILVITSVLFLSTKLLSSNSSNDISSCTKLGQDHVVEINNSQIVPEHTTGKLCDRLTIINKDNVIRLLAFGTHAHHQPYDGVGEKILDINQSLTVTLNQSGTYLFHDHIHEQVKGSFTVVN